jgi:hypothetical protein
MYTIGNALTAQTMLKHDIAAGLNIPSRPMIYEDAVNRTPRLTHDLPPPLMRTRRVTAAAEDLDAKLIALATHATGTEA